MKKRSDHLKLVKDKPVHKKRGRKVFRSLLFLALFTALIFLLREGESYFRVTDINVVGAYSVTAEELVRAGGITEGNSIFLIRENEVFEGITSEYPVVKAIEISRTLPDSIVINVLERKPVGYLMTADGFWMIDREAVCFSNSGEPIEGLPLITGVEGKMVVPGYPILCSARRELLKSFFNAGIREDWLEIVQIDLTDSYNLVLHTGEGLEIWVGNAADLEQKLKLVKESLLHLPDDVEAKLDVRSGNRLVVSKKEILGEKEVDQ